MKPNLRYGGLKGFKFSASFLNAVLAEKKLAGLDGFFDRFFWIELAYREKLHGVGFPTRFQFRIAHGFHNPP